MSSVHETGADPATGIPSLDCNAESSERKLDDRGTPVATEMRWPRFVAHSPLEPQACLPRVYRDIGLYKKSKFFYGPVSPNFCARRSVMMILKPSKTAVVLI